MNLVHEAMARESQPEEKKNTVSGNSPGVLSTADARQALCTGKKEK